MRIERIDRQDVRWLQAFELRLEEFRFRTNGNQVVNRASDSGAGLGIFKRDRSLMFPREHVITKIHRSPTYSLSFPLPIYTRRVARRGVAIIQSFCWINKVSYKDTVTL